MNIDRAIQHLQETANLLLPHGIYPGSYIGGHSGEFTETEWSAYGWNPNPQFPGDGTDASASPKPTWAELVAADAASRLIDNRNSAIAAVSQDATRRITAAYGARDVDHEIRIRLRGSHTAAQDAERVRLHERHDRLQEWIADTNRTLAELESFDPTADGHWTEATVMP